MSNADVSTDGAPTPHTGSGDVIDLKITGVAHGGVFVGRHEGRVVFVPDVIPGETARVRITEQKSSFWRAEALEVLEASEYRQPHVWPEADITALPENRPGGADFGHITLAHQRALKKQVIDDALERVGHVTLASSVEPALESTGAEDTGLHWRTRVSLHVDDAGVLGPFAARSHRVIAFSSLPLATESIESVALNTEASEPGGLDFVQASDGVVRIVAREPVTGDRRRGGRRRAARTVDPMASAVIVETVGGREFRVDAGSFWQVHRLAPATLTGAIGDALAAVGGVDPGAHHLDLYGGVGLLAAAIGDIGGPLTRMTSVESDPRATEHAGENLAEWVGARAETARVDRWLTHLHSTLTAQERGRIQRGVTVLDPPRSGAGREVVESVARLSPAAVVYVACDPVALARDLGTFANLGYRATTVRGYDLFPQSHHIEAVVLLTRD